MGRREANDAALWRAAFAFLPFSFSEHSGFQPSEDESIEHSVFDPATKHFTQGLVWDAAKVIPYVQLDDPMTSTADGSVNSADCLVAIAPFPITIGAVSELSLEYGLYQQDKGFLQNFVLISRNA